MTDKQKLNDAQDQLKGAKEHITLAESMSSETATVKEINIAEDYAYDAFRFLEDSKELYPEKKALKHFTRSINNFALGLYNLLICFKKSKK